MTRMTINFEGCGRLAAETGGDQDWMFAMVYFDVEQDGKSLGSFQSELKLTQGVGSGAADIEVALPTPLGSEDHGKPVMPHGAFTEAARAYMLRIMKDLGSRDFDIEIMRRPWSTSFEVEESGGGW